MTEAHKFLRGVRDGLIEIEVLRNNRNQLAASLLPRAIRPREVDVQESAPQDRISGVEAKIADMDAVIGERVKRLETDWKYAHEVIMHMDSSKHRTVLTLYYLTTQESKEIRGKNDKEIVGQCLLSWDDVAVRMGKSVDWVKKLHGDALEEFGRIARL